MALRNLRSALIICLTILFSAPSGILYAENANIPPWGRNQSRPEDLRIVLLTFGPGDDIASWFGHSAVLIEDKALKVQRVYNYGMFSFGPELIPQFLSGRLEFWVGEAGLPGTIRVYRTMNRDIRMQELDLSMDLRLRMARALAMNVLPENRYYMYHHYDDNCATRIRDIIDDVLDGQLRDFSEKNARMTLRDHTRRHTMRNPFVDFVLMLWMNNEIDRPVKVWDEMFLPGEMERVLDSFSYYDEKGNKRPLVARKSTVYSADNRKSVPEIPRTDWPFLFLLGLIVGTVSFFSAFRFRLSKKRFPRIILGANNVLTGILLGLPATLLFLMWLFTEHTVTYRNENIFFTSPLTLFALPFGIALIAGTKHAARRLMIIWFLLAATSALGLLLKILPGFDQQNLMVIALLLPINIGNAAAFYLVSDKPFSFKKIPSHSTGVVF